MLRSIFLIVFVIIVGKLTAQPIWAYQLSTFSQLNKLDSKYHRNVPNFGGTSGVNVAFPIANEKLSISSGASLYYYYFNTKKASYPNEEWPGEMMSRNIDQNYNSFGIILPVGISYHSRYLSPFIGVDIAFMLNKTTLEDIVNSSAHFHFSSGWTLIESYIITTFNPLVYYAKTGFDVKITERYKLKFQYSYSLNNYIEMNFKKRIENEVVIEEENFNSHMQRFEIGMVYYPKFERENKNRKPLNETLKKFYK